MLLQAQDKIPDFKENMLQLQKELSIGIDNIIDDFVKKHLLNKFKKGYFDKFIFSEPSLIKPIISTLSVLPNLFDNSTRFSCFSILWWLNNNRFLL